jgi:RNA polymerase sigma-70 factor (ECF subfamily)
MAPKHFDADDVRRLKEAVKALPARQCAIFLAHCVDDLSYAEIASRTGISVRKVERHLAKAIYELGRQMDGHSLSWWERWS